MPFQIGYRGGKPTKSAVVATTGWRDLMTAIDSLALNRFEGWPIERPQPQPHALRILVSAREPYRTRDEDLHRAHLCSAGKLAARTGSNLAAFYLYLFFARASP